MYVLASLHRQAQLTLHRLPRSRLIRSILSAAGSWPLEHIHTASLLTVACGRMMMTSGAAEKYKSMFDAFTKIVGKEGPRALFGMPTMLPASFSSKLPLQRVLERTSFGESCHEPRCVVDLMPFAQWRGWCCCFGFVRPVSLGWEIARSSLYADRFADSRSSCSGRCIRLGRSRRQSRGEDGDILVFLLTFTPSTA